MQHSHKMTNIYLKGIISKKFGNFFKMKISNAMSAIRAIEANKGGFINELFQLHRNNINYIIICDLDLIKDSNELLEKRKIKNIYILPAIIGSGEFAAVAMGLVTQAGQLTLAGSIVSSVINTLIGGLVNLGVSLIASSLNKQASPPQQNIAVGGVTASIEARGKSYVFSNRENVAQQATSIPVGYGLMKSPSKIISISIKNYSTDTNPSREFKNFQNSSIFLDYLTD
jgi:predicted phage tail protein